MGTLTRTTILDKIEHLPDTLVTDEGTGVARVVPSAGIQVRWATYILEDGKIVAGPTYHRSAYTATADLTAEDERVQALAAVAWDPELRQTLAAFRGLNVAQKNQVRAVMGLPRVANGQR